MVKCTNCKHFKMESRDLGYCWLCDDYITIKDALNNELPCEGYDESNLHDHDAAPKYA